MSGARTLRWPHLARHRLAVALLLVLSPALALIAARSASLLPAGGGARPVGSSQPSLQITSGALPQGAVGPVSAALGAVDPSYHLHPGGSAARAVNRGQGFVASLTAGGVSVSEGSLAATLRTTAAGFGSSPAAVAPAAAHVASNRVTYDRPGVEEWYANGPFGLEQGFTVARPGGFPDGAGELHGHDRRLRQRHADARRARKLARAALSLGGNGALRGSARRGCRQAAAAVVALASRRHAVPARAYLRRALPDLDRPPPHGRRQSDRTRGAEGEAPEKPAFGTSVAISGDGATALVGAPDGESQTGAAWIFHREGAEVVPAGAQADGFRNRRKRGVRR